MSSSHLFLKAGFPKAVLSNGLGRYICQLQRITIKFCKHSGSSRGIREFIEQDLVDFAKNNPEIVIYIKPRRHRSPVFVAEYLNGDRKWMSTHNFTRDEIVNWLNLLKTKSFSDEVKLRKSIKTLNPSIQGPWNPFMFKNPDFNISKFPDPKLSEGKFSPTATDILLNMFKAQKLEEETEKMVENKPEEKVEIKS